MEEGFAGHVSRLLCIMPSAVLRQVSRFFSLYFVQLRIAAVGAMQQGTDGTQDSPFLPSEQLPSGDHSSMPAPPAQTPANVLRSSPSDKCDDAPAAGPSTTPNSDSCDCASDKNAAAPCKECDELSFPSCDDWCYPDCDPLWTVRADSLFLNRSSPGSKLLLTDHDNFFNFDASEFKFPVQIGWDIDLQRRLDGDWSVEGRFFDLGVRGANATAPQAPAGGGVLYANGNVAGIFNLGAVNSSLNYESRLQSVEINLRRDYCPNLTLLAGVRYFQLTDEITVDQVAVNNSGYDQQQLKAYNGLIGFQLGADATLWSQGRFSLETGGRVGVYGDAARNHLSFASYNYIVQSGTNDGAAAFVTEASVRASYKLTDRWSVVAGYEFL